MFLRMHVREGFIAYLGHVDHNDDVDMIDLGWEEALLRIHPTEFENTSLECLYLRVRHPSLVLFELAVMIAVAPISLMEVDTDEPLDSFVDFQHYFALKISVFFQVAGLIKAYIISRSFWGKYRYPIFSDLTNC